MVLPKCGREDFVRFISLLKIKRNFAPMVIAAEFPMLRLENLDFDIRLIFRTPLGLPYSLKIKRSSAHMVIAVEF